MFEKNKSEAEFMSERWKTWTLEEVFKISCVAVANRVVINNRVAEQLMSVIWFETETNQDKTFFWEVQCVKFQILTKLFIFLKILNLVSVQKPRLALTRFVLTSTQV